MSVGHDDLNLPDHIWLSRLGNNLGTLRLPHQLSAPPAIRLELLKIFMKPHGQVLPNRPQESQYLCNLKSISTWARIVICFFLFVVFKIFDFNFIMIYGHNYHTDEITSISGLEITSLKLGMISTYKNDRCTQYFNRISRAESVVNAVRVF